MTNAATPRPSDDEARAIVKCPKCDGEPVYDHSVGCVLECSSCGLCTKIFDSGDFDGPKAAWNRGELFDGDECRPWTPSDVNTKPDFLPDGQGVKKDLHRGSEGAEGGAGVREGIWAETLAGRSTDELLEAAIAHVGDLCAERKTWRMCVPPQWDDSDALLAGTLRRCRKELAESRAALDAAREQVQHVITDRDASRGEMQQWKEKWRETQEALDAARRNLANERAAFDSLKGANQQALGALDAARKERAIDREAFEDLDRERVKEITREKARADGMQQERDAARAEAEAIIRGLLDSIDAYYFIHEPKPDSEWDEYAYWMGPRWLAAHRFVNPNPPQEETGRGKVGEG